MKLTFKDVEVTDSTNVLDINVPKQMEHNVSTGHKVIDILFAGDGITPSTVALITGQPGAGKSTLMMQLADKITGSGNIALYNVGEESLYQVRRTARRLNLKHGFIVGQDRKVQDIVSHAEILQTKFPNKKVFLFQDSLQCLELDREPGQKGRPPGGAAAQMLGLEKLTEWAKNTFNVLFVVGHVNKKGEFAGKNAIKHVVDCHLHLCYVVDSNTYDEVPIAEMQKNRFGVGGLYYKFDLNEHGIKFHMPNKNVKSK